MFVVALASSFKEEARSSSARSLSMCRIASEFRIRPDHSLYMPFELERKMAAAMLLSAFRPLNSEMFL